MISDSQIVDRIEELIRKLVQETATPYDRAELETLQKIRVNRMMPKFDGKRSVDR